MSVAEATIFRSCPVGAKQYLQFIQVVGKYISRHTLHRISLKIACIRPGMLFFYDAIPGFQYMLPHGEFVIWNMKMHQILPASEILRM